MQKGRFPWLALAVTVMLALAVASPAMAADIPSEVTLFRNVNIFDGKSEKLLEGYDVLVVGNLIKQIAKDIPISGTYEVDVKTGGLKRQAPVPGDMHLHGYTVFAPTEEGKLEKKQVKANVIDGGGRTLMPGMIDIHWHLAMSSVTFDELANEDISYVDAMAVREAGKTLQRGFTTIRSAGGMGDFGLKKAIDEGVIEGPRVYPTGAMISQTSGHGDFAGRFDRAPTFGGNPSKFDERGIVRIADGPDQVAAAVRENLRHGATQIKLMAGGGVSSEYDPLDVTEYFPEEMEAAVNAAKDWGTYVLAHVYTPMGIDRALRAGVRSIEHGHLMSEYNAKLMAEKGAFLSIQPFLKEDTKSPAFETVSKGVMERYLQACEGFENTMRYVKKYNIKIGFGTDLLFSRDNSQQANQLARYKNYMSNVEILRMATSTNGEVLAWSGKRNPYPDGPLGVITAGAYADILLVDGNPLEDVSILGDGGKNIPLIMKDGNIFKNTLK
jgi:imidazolonepropionase-like amidohydrolase